MAIGDLESGIISHAPLEVVYGEKPVTPVKPPHHLLETQIFPQLDRNKILQVQPEQVSFVIGQDSLKKLRVINKSAVRQNFHILEPLNTQTWLISYTKPNGGLIPGGAIDITVKFIRSKVTKSICQDAIRIHSAGGNLLIPLYAYPTIKAADWPDKINFGSIPLGQESTRVIRLSSDGEPFNYSCTLHPPSTVFDIEPSFGTINGDKEIVISYKPNEFVTSSTNMQIVFSTFDRKLLKCKINGNCLPGLLTQQKKREFALKRREKVKSREPSELMSNLLQKPKRKVIAKPPEQPIQRLKPGATYHINKILNSKEKSATKNIHSKSYTDKSKLFREKLKLLSEEEKTNQLKWQIRRGYDLPGSDEMNQIVHNRDDSQVKLKNRTERSANFVSESTPNFDPYRNSPWRARHVALGKFQQAARTVLIRIRGDMRLNKLRKLLKVMKINLSQNLQF